MYSCQKQKIKTNVCITFWLKLRLVYVDIPQRALNLYTPFHCLYRVFKNNNSNNNAWRKQVTHQILIMQKAGAERRWLIVDTRREWWSLKWRRKWNWNLRTATVTIDIKNSVPQTKEKLKIDNWICEKKRSLENSRHLMS